MIEQVEHSGLVSVHELDLVPPDPKLYGGGAVRVGDGLSDNHTGKPLTLLIRADHSKTWTYIAMNAEELDELITVLSYYKLRLASGLDPA